MNKTERLKMVSAMEFIARQINDEAVFLPWICFGVADKDIEYGTLCEDENYIEDETFSDLMGCFLRRMRDAYMSGGLYCDGIISAD